MIWLILLIKLLCQTESYYIVVAYNSNKFVGFFQLYKQSSIHTYKDSVNCGKCDDDFRNLFNIRYTLKLSVKHLGKEGVNWNGRFDDTKL